MLPALQAAAAGLSYQSETDAPWEAFAWPQADGEPTAAGVKKVGGHPARAKVEEQAVDEFFGPLVQEQDWFGDEEEAAAAKYRGLLAAVKQLGSPKVYAVGGRKKTVYVVGNDPSGGWAGVKAAAVET